MVDSPSPPQFPLPLPSPPYSSPPPPSPYLPYHVFLRWQEDDFGGGGFKAVFERRKAERRGICDSAPLTYYLRDSPHIYNLLLSLVGGRVAVEEREREKGSWERVRRRERKGAGRG